LRAHRQTEREVYEGEGERLLEVPIMWERRTRRKERERPARGAFRPWRCRGSRCGRCRSSAKWGGVSQSAEKSKTNGRSNKEREEQERKKPTHLNEPINAGLERLVEGSELEVGEVLPELGVAGGLLVLSVGLGGVPLREDGSGVSSVSLLSSMPTSTYFDWEARAGSRAEDRGRWERTVTSPSKPTAFTIDSATCLIVISSSSPTERMMGSISVYSANEER
jgi:hypothetical protein